MRAGAFLLLLASCGPAPPGPVPADLVGTWPDPGSKMDGLTLVEGGVLYITGDGTGVSWGTGPPPLGSPLLLWFDPRSSTLYSRMPKQGDWEAMAAFDSLSGRLKGGRPDAQGAARLSSSIPDEIRSTCGPELWVPERARQKALVDGMTLYFPSFGYRELNPAQRAADPLRYREEALKLLQDAGEPPLGSLPAPGTAEGFRLIGIGDRGGFVRVQRDAMGAAWVDAVPDPRSGKPRVRRRALSAEDWAGLERKVRAARVAELPLRVGEKSDVVDGWILERWSGVHPKVVECPDPNRDEFRKLCEHLESLGRP